MNGCRLVVVIPIVWESCVWLRPVGVVSIASCSIQQNESPVCVGVFLSYRAFSLAIFRCAVQQFYPLRAIFIISTEIPSKTLFHAKSFPFFPLFFFFLFFSPSNTSNSASSTDDTVRYFSPCNRFLSFPISI